MGFFGFIFQTVVISLTGVMLPGPMTAVTVGRGSKNPFAGLLLASGHGIVEIPLIVLIYFGLGFIFKIILVKSLVPFLVGCGRG